MKRILILLLLCGSGLFAASLKQTTVGYSYVILGDADYQAIEIGTSIVAITKKGIVRPYTGVEVSVPLFFDSKGSNIQNADNKGSGFGVALQVPLIFGLEIGGFYIQAMGGYNLSWLNDALRYIPSGANVSALKTAKTKTISQGFIYGGGVGYNFSVNFTMGLRFIKGSMNNEIINDPSADAIDKKYKTNYTKIMALIGYSF
ncbi:hypothetical protein CCY99_02415 [Helicobacter sp. 16-1353]|uniref:hypothetical protein n=1 Tax=Helicobacter sp. 16-1353 TaxID=2004996 RepID=UPI000DCB80D4|nr:hypothetical protein [Helicobacter sp. 16-1353]RAX54636.1 hypothetical protein CCY99_02415 [Helicobacter sp. 16-1353]